MQYYKIYQETDQAIIGKYPQLKELRIKPLDARIRQLGIISKWKTDDDVPELHQFNLGYRSKLTDSLTSDFTTNQYGLFLSEKAKSVFDQFNSNGKFYPATVYQRDVPHPYYFLKYEFGGRSHIDWKKSTFIEYHNSIRDIRLGDEVQVADAEDYKVNAQAVREKYSEELWWELFPKTITLTQPFDFTPLLSYFLICNERFKNAVEAARLTGFIFEAIDLEIEFNE